MNLLDWLLVAVGLAYAVSGYWQGFISGAFATVGLLLGGAGGFWLAPHLFGVGSSSLWVSLGALCVVLVCATLGQAIGQLLGSRLRDRIPWQPVRSLDAVGGAVLSTAAVLVVAWALGVAVISAGLPVVSAEVRSSTVLSRVDTVMPGVADRALQLFNRLVSSGSFPAYLEPFATERIRGVPAPPPGVARDPQVRAAGASVLKIRGDSSCGRGVEGTGFLYSPGRVLTNAHVVAGVENPRVEVDGEELPGRVVHFDPDGDIAVIAVDDIDRPVLRFDRDGRPRQSAAVLGYPNDGPYDVQAARIRSVQQLRSPDIYRAGVVVREVFAIRSSVRPGNSGGPLVSADGKVLGVIFAASMTDKQTGYALTADQVAPGAAAAIGSDDPVDTGGCT